MDSINNKISDINIKLDKLDKSTEILNSKLDSIINILDSTVKSNCNKMGEHIDFIDNVYDTIKSPLTCIINKMTFFNKKQKINLDDKVKYIENAE